MSATRLLSAPSVAGVVASPSASPSPAAAAPPNATAGSATPSPSSPSSSSGAVIGAAVGAAVGGAALLGLLAGLFVWRRNKAKRAAAAAAADAAAGAKYLPDDKMGSGPPPDGDPGPGGAVSVKLTSRGLPSNGAAPHTPLLGEEPSSRGLQASGVLGSEPSTEQMLLFGQTPSMIQQLSGGSGSVHRDSRGAAAAAGAAARVSSKEIAQLSGLVPGVSEAVSTASEPSRAITSAARGSEPVGPRLEPSRRTRSSSLWRQATAGARCRSTAWRRSRRASMRRAVLRR